MKKIIVCVALSIISILSAVVSFVSNDITSYRAWMTDSAPQIMQRFDKGPKPDKHFKADKPDKHFDREDKHHDDHHDKEEKRDKKDRRETPPPAPAPAPQQAPETAAPQDTAPADGQQ